MINGGIKTMKAKTKYFLKALLEAFILLALIMISLLPRLIKIF